VSWIKSLCLCAASLMIAGSVIAFAEPPTSQPSSETEHHEGKGGKAMAGPRWGFAPYNRLSNMTEEQKQKISDIHRKANVERKAIDDKEDADVMALLTPEQKTELEKLSADKKAKAAEKRADGKKKDKSGGDDEKDKDKDK
jgi:Spy/CpxP family protein refolding chaperone